MIREWPIWLLFFVSHQGEVRAFFLCFRFNWKRFNKWFDPKTVCVLEDGASILGRFWIFLGLDCFDDNLFLKRDVVGRFLVTDYWFGRDYDFFPSFALYVISEVVCVGF
jgi:hypothetical protein